MLSLEAWRKRGAHIGTPDGRVFAVSTGDASGTPVLLLHGFPTSSWDFAAVMDRLAAKRRVVAFDFLGYGLSDKPAAFGYSLFEQADVATLVARAQGLVGVHVVAHDMGTSVATELLARRERGLLPFEIRSLTLMNGSLHVEMAHLTTGQRLLRSPLGPLFARLNTKQSFHLQLRRIFGKPVDEAELDVMWELVTRADGAARLPSLIRYVEERSRFERRWIGALEKLDIPALIAWGRRDPVAVLAIAERLAAEIPKARFIIWDDLGHYPQVEDPACVARDIGAFLDGVSG